MKGEYRTYVYTGGEEYMLREDEIYDFWYLYLISGWEDAILVHTSVSKKNMDSYLEDLRYANMDYDLNL